MSDGARDPGSPVYGALLEYAVEHNMNAAVNITWAAIIVFKGYRALAIVPDFPNLHV